MHFFLQRACVTCDSAAPGAPRLRRLRALAGQPARHEKVRAQLHMVVPEFPLKIEFFFRSLYVTNNCSTRPSLTVGIPA